MPGVGEIVGGSMRMDSAVGGLLLNIIFVESSDAYLIIYYLRN